MGVMEKFFCGIAAQWIGLVSLLIAYLIVQVVSGGLSGSSYLSDDLTGQNRVSCFYTDFLQTTTAGNSV